jgi:hypothetical protein
MSVLDLVVDRFQSQIAFIPWMFFFAEPIFFQVIGRIVIFVADLFGCFVWTSKHLG